MRPSVSSLPSRPHNLILSGRSNDALLLNEWFLALRGDGKSPWWLRQLSAS